MFEWIGGGTVDIGDRLLGALDAYLALWPVWIHTRATLLGGGGAAMEHARPAPQHLAASEESLGVRKSQRREIT